MSLRPLFLAVQSQLQSQVTTLQLVDLYKNQFEDTNHDNPEDNKQQAIPYPCAFIMFQGDNEQKSAGYGVKQLDVLITIKIGFESYNLTPIEMWDLMDSVELALDGFSDNTTFSRLTYRAQRVPQDITNISVYEFDYACTYQDTLCRTDRNDTIKTGSTLNPTVTPVPNL